MRYLLHDVLEYGSFGNQDNDAIIGENGLVRTYNQLNFYAHKFFGKIREIKGDSVNKKPLVGIISSVHHWSIASLFGVLQAGCAYVPLDEQSPTERLRKIVQNAHLETIIIDSYYLEKYTELLQDPLIENIIVLGDRDTTYAIDKRYTFLPDLLAKEYMPYVPYVQVSDDLAYVLHTSGSTGVPKGIMLTHRNARTFVDRMQKEFELTKQDVVMSRAPLKFDLSVFDVFNTIAAGATLICYDRTNKRSEEERHTSYAKLIKLHKATILYTTPSTFIALMNRGDLGLYGQTLRTIMYAGEPFAKNQLRMLHTILPNVKIANIYGPTETNIITYRRVTDFDSDEHVPLGYVVEDTDIIVVSEETSMICKPGELGELWCRGGTVTLGYLGMEDKTAVCLVKSPFHSFPIYYWRTGDLGYRDDNGLLYYKGRKDHMVKVKGFRIEILEVENAISYVVGLDEFCVVAVHDPKYTNRLYCYYTILDSYRSQVTREAIMETIRKHIPEYMIPFDFIHLEQMPKTSSGKIDRVLLADSLSNK